MNTKNIVKRFDRLQTYGFLRNLEIKKMQENFVIDKVKNINFTGRSIERAGVIIYCVKSGKITFVMGEDEYSSELTDFGGHTKTRDKTPIITALREFKEETLGVFGNFESKDVEEMIAICSNKMLIIFVKMEIDIKIYADKFRQNVKRKKRKDIEILDLVEMSGREWIVKIFKKLATNTDASPDTHTTRYTKRGKRGIAKKNPIYDLVSDFIKESMTTTRINIFDML